MGLIDRFKRGASGAETLGGFVTGGTLGMLTGMETETSKKSRAQEQSASALNQFFDSMAKRANLTDEQISNVQSAKKLAESMVNGGSKIEDAIKAASILASGSLDEYGVTKPLTQFQKVSLAQDQEQEKRRVETENRRQAQEFGATYLPENIAQLQNDFGADLDTLEAEGRVEKIIGSDGKPKFRVLSSKQFETAVNKGIVKPKELEDITSKKELIDEFNLLKEDIKKIGGAENLDNIIEDMDSESASNPFFAEVGPFSLPAKFNLVGQYSKDPKYTQIKSRLERMFNLYRKYVTGAQAGFAELGYLRNTYPSLSSKPSVMFSNMEGIINETDRALKTKLDLMKAAGRDTSNIEKTLYGGKTKSDKGNDRDRAIEYLKSNKATVSERNIKYVLSEWSKQ